MIAETNGSSETSNEQDGLTVVTLAADIVAAYVSKNTVMPADLPTLIENVADSLMKVAHSEGEAPSEPLTPAVPIKKSITPDYIVCLEDGKRFKSLRRHLRSEFDLSPEEYRKRWGLPSDYPMVAPNYAKKRSDLAKKIGLGRGRRTD